MKDDKVFLLHIRDAIQNILSYTTNGQQAFLSDSKTQDAVIRNLEIIGEASKKISETFKSNNPSIPWKPMSGMRDKLIHDYFSVNLEIIWNVVEQELPRLSEKLAAILNQT